MQDAHAPTTQGHRWLWMRWYSLHEASTGKPLQRAHFHRRLHHMSALQDGLPTVCVVGRRGSSPGLDQSQGSPCSPNARFRPSQLGPTFLRNSFPTRTSSRTNA